MEHLVMSARSQIKWVAALIALAAVFATTGMVIGVAYIADHAKEIKLVKRSAGGMVDVGFSQHMAWHHDQAVVMAKIVQGRASGRINLLADQIAADQLMEIGELKGWLKMWGAPLMPTSTSMEWIFKNRHAKWTVSPAYLELCRSTPGGVPGLATIDELNQLRSATGEKLDILFLQLMLRHHMSALPIARYAAENAESAIARSTAAKMVFDQRQEIGAMRTLLGQLGGQPLPFLDVDSL